MSEDDVPLASQASTTVNGTNGHVAQNGNGRARGASPMSEDDEDDMPLVCISTLNALIIFDCILKFAFRLSRKR